MAQKVNVLLVDDLDGSEAHETVPFGLDGSSYEIDLSLQHAAELRARLAEYAGKARKVRGPASRPRRTPAGTGRNKEIREWAKARGRDVNDRGRIPAGVLAEYDAEHGK